MISLNWIIDKIDDRINPIIVKELRQVVRGKFFWGVLIIFLGFQCTVLSLSIADRGLTNRSVGADTLTFLFGILFLASFVLIPLYSGFRFARERNEGTDELLYITTITPQTIIRGKFAASLIFVLVVFSAFAPFMAMTFFLSGVDLSVTFLLLAFGLLLSAGSIMLQICFGSLAHDSNALQFFRIAGAITQIMFFFSINAISADLIRDGLTRMFSSANFFSSIMTFVGFILAAGYFVYLAATAVIYPSGSNRMYPVRKTATIIWFLTLLVSWMWAIELGSAEIVWTWGYMATFTLNFFYLIAISERDYLTERVAKEIPKSGLGKNLAFLFYSGAAGGVAWTVIMQFLTLFAA